MHDTILFTLWFLVTVGMLWSIRDQNAKTHAILREVQQASKDIARFLGTDRR
jgi:hypothetical protein